MRYRRAIAAVIGSVVIGSVSDFIKSGNLDVREVIQKIYDRANKMYGTKLEPRTK